MPNNKAIQNAPFHRLLAGGAFVDLIAAFSNSDKKGRQDHHAQTLIEEEEKQGRTRSFVSLENTQRIAAKEDPTLFLKRL